MRKVTETIFKIEFSNDLFKRERKKHRESLVYALSVHSQDGHKGQVRARLRSEARDFWESSSAASPGQHKGAGPQVEQQGLERAPIWNAGGTGSIITC